MKNSATFQWKSVSNIDVLNFFRREIKRWKSPADYQELKMLTLASRVIIWWKRRNQRCIGFTGNIS